MNNCSDVSPTATIFKRLCQLGFLFLMTISLVGMANAAPKKGAIAAKRKAALKKKIAEEKKKDLKRKEQAAVPKRRIEISTLSPETQDRARAAAAMVDRLVGENFTKLNISPNLKTTDEQFVRRVYLDVVGRIPTALEVNKFLTNKAPNKRSDLIDDLLNSPGYSSHFFNYWADILRVTDKLHPQVPSVAYTQWIKESLEQNKPYDEFVYEMLYSNGKVWDNPASGYMIRDTGMPLDNMNNTIRTFLGTQIGCAQCHDHPFDRWTQKEFYQIAAFTYGAQTKVGAKDKKRFGGENINLKLRGEVTKIKPDENVGRYNRLINGNLFEVYDLPARKLKLPHDYAYDDAKPNQVINPKTLWGNEADLASAAAPREAFAQWVTSKENPRFAKTIANRLWKKLMGVGQIEPVDDITDDSVAENEKLMKFLSYAMIQLDFDMKEYLRILLNSEIYQRQASTFDPEDGDEYHFPGPLLRRMTAEQVWDSFITMSVPNADEYQARPAFVEADILNVDLTETSGQDLIDRLVSYQLAVGGKNKRIREEMFKYKGTEIEGAATMLLARASELPQPAPVGHFIRQFGQSDRELIQSSSTQGNVPQVLQMFNGPITHIMLDEKSPLARALSREPTTDGRIDAIFKTILGRAPTANELAIARKEITEMAAKEENKKAGYGNVIWALINTREFLFIQ